MRAVVDIGSNSILLLVAERSPEGALTIVRDEATVARISEGAAARGTLAREAIERGLAVLRRYVETARGDGIEAGTIEAVATEGLRMASNAQDFLEPAARILGGPVRLISGDEEARLSYRSVALEHPEEDPLRVLDIGGGSTELVVGHGLEVESAVSHPIGSVRLSERCGDGHPPSQAALAAMAQAARESFTSRQPLEPHRELYGLAGTVTTAAGVMLGLERYDRERVDRARFERAQIVELRDRLASQTLEQLRANPLIGEGRADVIVAGVTILATALEHCGAEILVVRDRGLRYALV